MSTSTEETSVAQDAVSCPAPDQVWDPDGGRVPDSALAPIPWSPGDRVRADVLDGLVALDAAYVERFGVHLTINSSYRTFEEQQGLYDPSSPIAAPPGCSNHGLGFAVDLGGGVQAFGTPSTSGSSRTPRPTGGRTPTSPSPTGACPSPGTGSPCWPARTAERGAARAGNAGERRARVLRRRAPARRRRA